MKTLVNLVSFYLLLFDCGLCKDSKYDLEALIKKSIENEIKPPLLSKRQLLNLNNEVSSDIYGGIDQETLEVASEETTLSKKKKTAPSISTIKTSKNTRTHNKLRVSIATTTKKHTEEEIATIPSTPNSLASNQVENIDHGLNETHLEVRESEFQIINDINDVCPYFTMVPELELDKMVDVWRVIRYRSHEKLACFTIYINKTLAESRKYYREKYSTFNETINWDKCDLEVTSTGTPQEEKRHFLQGHADYRGLLENIVLSQENENGTKIITLLDQTPDQWMVTQNLLLMRDCENGDVFLFSRIPTPKTTEIEEALLNFGEDSLDDFIPCDATVELDEPSVNDRDEILS